MKKILLAIIIFINAFSIAYSQCTPSVVITADKTIICANDAVTLTATPTNGGTAPTYTWYHNHGIIPGATNSTYTSTDVYGGAYYVVLVSSETCANPTTVISNEIYVQGPSVNTLTVYITATNMCAGGNVVFSATAGNGGYNPLFEWTSSVRGLLLSSTSTYLYESNSLVDGEVITVKMTKIYPCGGGSAISNPIAISLLPTVIPSVAITADKTTICSGDLVTFTATPTNGGTPTYKWRKNGTLIVPAATNSTYITTSAVNGDSYDVIMTSTANCASPLTANSNAIVMTVTPTATPGVAISASPQGVCSNNTVTFTATTLNGGSAPLYEWFINNASQGAPNFSQTFSTSGLISSSDVIRVNLTSSLVCALAPGTATASTSVTIYSGITAGTIGSDQTICYNSVPSAIIETSGPTGITGISIYTWEASLTGLNGSYFQIPGAISAGYTPTTPLTQDIYIRRVITDPATPYPCNVAISNVIHITVRPQLTSGVIGSDEAICTGAVPSTIIQTTAPTGGTGTYAYQWQSNMSGAFSNISGATNSNYTPPALTATTQFQRVETSVPCGSVTSNVVTKTLVAPEVVTASIIDPGQVCVGSIVTFTATVSTTGTGSISYQWFLGTMSVGTNSPNYTLNPVFGDNGKIVKAVVTTSNGCNAGPAVSNIVTLNIVGVSTPTITISGNPVNCIGLPITFTATSTGGGSSPVYQWHVIPQGSGLPVAVGTGGTTYSSSSLLNGDRIYVELTSSLACIVGTANPYKSNEITMTIKPIPSPSINEGNQTICAPNSFTFHGNVTAGNNYEWRQLPTNTVVGTGTDFIATQSGSYSIREDNGTCSTTSAPAILTVDPCGAFSTAITGPNPITSGQQNAVYSVPNQAGFTYTWSITGGTIVSGQSTNAVTVDWDAATANSFARTTSTVYSISVLEKNPSNQTKTTTSTINTITTGTALSQAQSGINVFPNPTTGSFNIEMPENGVEVTYEILDITGLSVASGTFTSAGSDQYISADFGAGMYQVVLKYNNVVTCVRLSKVQ